MYSIHSSLDDVITCSFSILIVFMLFLAGCSGNGDSDPASGYNGENTTPPPADPPPTEDVSFANDIQPIFNSSCGGSGCHIDQTTNGVRLNSHENVTSSEGAQYGELIVQVGNPDDSPLVDKIESDNPKEGERMPLNGNPLSDTQIEAIRTWIDEGANNN